MYIQSTNDEFKALGYEYGDSVNVTFTNGYTLTDIPYYNGYYTDIGDALLIGYPGRDHIKVAVNYGDDIWEIAGLSEADTATIELNERVPDRGRFSV